jgi:Flp pilus assembly protein TadD
MHWTGPLLAALIALGAASAAHAGATTFLGSGAARECYLAAKAGASNSTDLNLCTLAIDTQAMNDRDLAATYTNRGVIRLQRRDAANARTDFTTALKLRPDMGEAHVNLGAALIMLGDFNGGVAAIDKGLELKTDQAHDAYFNRGVAREQLGDMVGAYRDYSEAARLAPNWELPKQELARFTVETKSKTAP